MKNKVHKELDLLNKSLPFQKHLQHSYPAPNKNVYNIIDWFINGGHIRTYNRGTKSKPYFEMALVKGSVKFNLGTFGDFTNPKMNYIREYLKYFWKKNKNLIYCTSNLLKSLDTEKTPSGNENYFLSTDNKNSFVKNSNKVIELLNNL